MAGDRRDFFKRAVLALGAWPAVIDSALAVPAARRSGSIADVEHVVILMQENRSFDHYFGAMRGVRGFSDPRAIALPSGDSVWHQPATDGTVVAPFHLDSADTAAQWLPSLDHSWKGSHERWKHHDVWIAEKTPLTMGYFTRADLPFYYALADAFTVCDAYHCSIFGPTNPNRLFLFTGTNGLAVGNDGPQAIVNTSDEPNETADQANDAKNFAPYSWTTYAERLGAAGIDWCVYQEYDNFGDNTLAYFAQFRGLDPASDAYRRGRNWAQPSTGLKNSLGDHLVEMFAADVAAGKLPQVSWIVAPTAASEHPEACPGFGQALTARLIAALAAHPDVWAKTVFILNYDENDGFFDHVPPPLPATTATMGASTVSVDGENYKGEPVGLGVRVPMLIVSPWTKGGFVNSELFDHTSVIRFLEARFGVMEPNITPWRRAVCGDLTSAFDFSAGGGFDAELPDTADYTAAATAAKARLPYTQPLPEALPVQESGQRPARPLPYDLEVTGRVQDGGLAFDFINRGAAGACFSVVAGKDGPWFYTVEAGKRLSANLPVTALSVHGPNGFLRRFEEATASGILVESRYDPATEELVLILGNQASESRDVSVRVPRHGDLPPRVYAVPPGGSAEHRQPLAASDHWYDLEVRAGGTVRQLAGHAETGRVSRSDPALGGA